MWVAAPSEQNGEATAVRKRPLTAGCESGTEVIRGQGQTSEHASKAVGPALGQTKVKCMKGGQIKYGTVSGQSAG